MKLFPFLLALLICQLTFSQNITVKTANNQEDNIDIVLPVNATAFWGGKRTFQLDNHQSVSFANPLTAPGIVYIKEYGFFIEPETAYTIELDETNKEKPFVFTGPNAEGEYLLASRKAPFYQAKAREYLNKDSSMSNIKKAIQNDAAKDLQPFEDLYVAKK